MSDTLIQAETTELPPRGINPTWSWLLAGVSLACASILGIGGIWISGELHQALSYRELESALDHKDFNNSARFLDTYLADNFLYKKLQTLDPEHSMTGLEERKQTLLSLQKIIWLLSTSDYEAALAQVNSLNTGMLHTLLSQDPTQSQRLATMGAYLEHFARFDKMLKTFRLKSGTNPERIQELQKQIKEQTSLAEDLGLEFAQFLGLTPAPNAADGSLEFYQSGIFTGFPKLDKLPDGIESTQTLKETLTEIGGAVAVKGTDAPQLFQEKLDTLQKNARVFYEVIQGDKDELQKLQNEQQELQKDVYDHSQVLLLETSDLLRATARPQPSSITHFILSVFQ